MLSILFVEDDTTIAMGVEYSLKQDGFQVSLAYRLEEARDLLKRQPFDLVLLDLGLPDGSGMSCAKKSAPPGIRLSSSSLPATKRPVSFSALTWAQTTTSPSLSACAS